MLRCLFWNINRKPLGEPLRLLCARFGIDLLILAECRMSEVELLLAVNEGSQRTFSADTLANRIRFMHRIPGGLHLVRDTDYCSIRAVTPPGCDELLIAAIHLRSKLHATQDDQNALMFRTASVIREVEGQRGHERTVVVGDLNMNPFEPGICSADGLHGVMCKKIARQEGRIVAKERRTYFYNPMWNTLGDETPGPPGTYFYRGSTVSYFWNTFDQVLLRPALLNTWRSDDVQVVHELEGVSLLDEKGIPSKFSDHLPVFFCIRD